MRTTRKEIGIETDSTCENQPQWILKAVFHLQNPKLSPRRSEFRSADAARRSVEGVKWKLALTIYEDEDEDEDYSKGWSDDASITTTLSANPRNATRRGFGWRAFEALLAMDGRMTWAAYKKAGGRPNDLRWDLERGHLEVKDGEN